MVEQPAYSSRNPNLCASCSSMADGMNDENGVAATLDTGPPAAAPSAGQEAAIVVGVS